MPTIPPGVPRIAHRHLYRTTGGDNITVRKEGQRSQYDRGVGQFAVPEPYLYRLILISSFGCRVLEADEPLEILIVVLSRAQIAVGIECRTWLGIITVECQNVVIIAKFRVERCA